MVFDISFKEVVLSEERTVSREGRISGMSRYKGRRVNIVVEKSSEIECNDPPWQKYPYQVELDAHTYSSDNTRVEVSGSDAQIKGDAQYTPTTKEIMEAI